MLPVPQADGPGAVSLVLGALGVLGSLAVATMLAQHFGLVALWPQAGLSEADLDSLGSGTEAFGSRGSLIMGSGMLCPVRPPCYLWPHPAS